MVLSGQSYHGDRSRTQLLCWPPTCSWTRCWRESALALMLRICAARSPMVGAACGAMGPTEVTTGTDRVII